MRRRRRSRGAILLTVLLALAGGCRSDFTRQDQQKLQQLYYFGDLDRAAELSMKMSDAENGETGREALLWHLEAGSINLDAGRFDEALTALERAEKLFWLFDRQGRIRLHRPGTATYHGYRNDRLVLGMLKFFTYFSRGELEDALVEIRRLRAGQYLYLLKESDPNLREYDQENFGRKVAPYRLRKLEKENQTAAGTFRAAGVQAEYGEYKDRLRPRLALLFNPLPFYLSALGYYWDNQFDEAAVDLKYLFWLQPDNELFRRDYATVLHLLGEKIPPELASVKPWDYPLTDNLAVVILAQGIPPGWKERNTTVRLPGMVPGHWKFNLPENTRAQALTLRASGGGRHCIGSELADLTSITQDEFWQLTMPELAGGAAAAIRSKTIEHEAAKASLAALLASPNFDGKALAVAAATAQVAATSSVSINDTDWRRWVTIAQRYRILHLPIPANREITVEVEGADRKSLFRKTLKFEPETTRALIYLREAGGKFYLKQWSTME